jgi:hypothetical protein
MLLLLLLLLLLLYRFTLASTYPSRPDPLTNRPPGARTPRISAAVAAAIVVPAIVADASDRASHPFLELFAAAIRNKNTRLAYLHAAGKFFAWYERRRRPHRHADGKAAEPRRCLAQDPAPSNGSSHEGTDQLSSSRLTRWSESGEGGERKRYR